MWDSWESNAVFEFTFFTAKTRSSTVSPTAATTTGSTIPLIAASTAATTAATTAASTAATTTVTTTASTVHITTAQLSVTTAATMESTTEESMMSAYLLVLDGQWSDWDRWSACTVTCGNGTKLRSRRCDDPEPLNGGRNCTGKSEETAECATWICPGESDRSGVLDNGAQRKLYCWFIMFLLHTCCFPLFSINTVYRRGRERERERERERQRQRER